MLRLARIVAGNRVLDVAAGAGEPALSAASRVGPGGYVLATDISANILGFAEQVAKERGLTNLETRVMDGENLELPDSSFDAVLSRLGLIYFPNRDRGLTEMHRVLQPGGCVVAASFTTPKANRFFSIPVSIIRRWAQLPPPVAGQPGPFSLGAPGVLDAALRRANFENIETEVIRTPLRLGSAAECVRFERESFGALQQMLAALSEGDQQAAWAEIESEMRSLEGSGGFEAGTELIVGGGTKPSPG